MKQHVRLDRKPERQIELKRKTGLVAEIILHSVHIEARHVDTCLEPYIL